MKHAGPFRLIAGAALMFASAAAVEPLRAQDAPPPAADDPPGVVEKAAPKDPDADAPSDPIVKGQSAGDVNAAVEEPDRQNAGLFELGPVTRIDRTWQEWNDQLDDSLGLRLSMAYTTLYQRATNGPGRREGAAGDFDLVGKWYLLNRDRPGRGAIGFALEDRHRFTAIPPSRLGREIGALWSTTNNFNDRSMALIQFWWEQRFADDRARLTVGKIDPTNYYDVNRAANANTLFLNRAFTSNPARNFPGNGLGANLLVELTDDVHLSLGAQDMNGRMTHAGFDTFGDLEWFYAVELDFIERQPGRQDAHYRLGFWYNDAAEDGNDEVGRGVGINIEQPLSDRDGLFFRYGWQDRRGTPTRQIASLGYLSKAAIGRIDNIVGFAAGWGQPADRDRDDQYVLEAFYRIQLTPNIQLTPGYQLIIDPTNNPDQDVIGVFSLRYRLVF